MRIRNPADNQRFCRSQCVRASPALYKKHQQQTSAALWQHQEYNKLAITSSTTAAAHRPAAAVSAADKSRMSTADADCGVIGSGPAGLTAALALAEVGASVIVTGPAFRPDPQRPDTRTTAIFSGGIALLRRLRVWGRCADAAAPLQAIRIIDDTGRLLRAPETCFNASEIGADSFGYNIPNAALVGALHEAVAASDAVRFIETKKVTGIDIRHDQGAVFMTLAESAMRQSELRQDELRQSELRQISTRLLAGADGRSSIARQAAGIAPYSWDYDQAAVVCSFNHQRGHDNISTEFHRANGPFTTIPLPGNMSSLVWVESKQQARHLQALDDDAMAMAIETRLGGLLGAISNVGPRAHFPLSGMAARSLAANRIALIGEAAHVVPPIGAQGLNLGFRDGAALADAVADALSQGRDPGSDAVLSQFRAARRMDVLSRTLAIDLLNRTLLSNLLPAQALRGAGLFALNTIKPLRRFVMREGLQPGSTLPRLMRPMAEM